MEIGMKLTNLFITIILSSFLCLPSVLKAGSYEVDGYRLSMLVLHQKGNILKLTGRIKGGPKCKRLQLKMFLRNESEDEALVICVVDKVGGKVKRLMSGTTTVYSEDDEWEISNIYVECLRN